MEILEIELSEGRILKLTMDEARKVRDILLRVFISEEPLQYSYPSLPYSIEIGTDSTKRHKTSEKH